MPVVSLFRIRSGLGGQLLVQLMLPGYLQEILDEIRNTDFGEEGGILVIQGEGNNLKEAEPILQWTRIVQ